MKRLMILLLIGACVWSPKWAAAQDLYKSLDEAKDLLNGMANGMLKTDLVQVGKRKEAAAKLRSVAGDLIRLSLRPKPPARLPLRPQAPSKVAPAAPRPPARLPSSPGPQQGCPCPRRRQRRFRLLRPST